MLRMGHDLGAFTLLAKCGNPVKQNCFDIYIYIYINDVIIQYQLLLFEKTLTTQCYCSILPGCMVKSVVMRMNRFTRILLWWSNGKTHPSGIHIYNIDQYRHNNFAVHFCTSQTIFNTFRKHLFTVWPVLEWHICDICQLSAMYVTTTNGVYDIYGVVWVLCGSSITFLFCIIHDTLGADLRIYKWNKWGPVKCVLY